MATETVEEYADGQLVSTHTVTVAESDANHRQIVQRAREALADNRAFLAKPSPSNAQVLAQVRSLTQQANALIRLAVGDLGGTD